MPLPRTVHMVNNVRLGPPRGEEQAVLANWQVHSHRFQATDTLYGRYEYALVPRGGEWRIRRKKIVLVNDVINTVLDINQV